MGFPLSCVDWTGLQIVVMGGAMKGMTSRHIVLKQPVTLIVSGYTPRSYQPLLAFTMRTTSSMAGTSISTPTTVASAAPE